jgi:hypothetical protein
MARVLTVSIYLLKPDVLSAREALREDVGDLDEHAFSAGSADGVVFVAPAVQNEPDWVKLRPPGGGTGLAFQTEPIYRTPTWPAVEGAQQIGAHLDFEVDDLEAACEHAEATGAVLADFQPADDVRVYLDPVGHPFCLFLPEPESPAEL